MELEEILIKLGQHKDVCAENNSNNNHSSSSSSRGSSSSSSNSSSSSSVNSRSSSKQSYLERLVLPRLCGGHDSDNVIHNSGPSGGRCCSPSSSLKKLVHCLKTTCLQVHCVEIWKGCVDNLTLEEKRNLFESIGRLPGLQDLRLGYSSQFHLEMDVVSRALEGCSEKLLALRFFRLKVIATIPNATATTTASSWFPRRRLRHRHRHRHRSPSSSSSLSLHIASDEYCRFLNSLSKQRCLEKFIYDRAEFRVLNVVNSSSSSSSSRNNNDDDDDDNDEDNENDDTNDSPWVGLIRALSQALASKTLQVVFIRETQLSTRHPSQIQIPCASLRLLFCSCINLKTVSLRYLRLTDEHVIQIVQTLIDTTTTTESKLEFLDLSDNFMGDAAGAALANFLSQQSCNLKHLSLRWNHLGDDACQAIMMAISNNTNSTHHSNSSSKLKQLELSGNTRMGIKSAISISNALQQNLPIDDSCILTETFRTRYTSTQSSLTHLDIDQINFHVDAIKIIAKGLPGNRTLQHLNISGNHIDDEACIAIATALGQQPHKQSYQLASFSFLPTSSLKRLDLSRNHSEISESGYRALVDMLQHRNFILEHCITWCDQIQFQSKIQFYCKLNKDGNRYQLHHHENNLSQDQWIQILHSFQNDISCLYYVIRNYPQRCFMPASIRIIH